MARRKSNRKAKPEAPAVTPDTGPEASPPGEPAIDAADETPQGPASQAPGPTAHAADPHAKLSVSLSDHRGGPSMHLLRSRKYHQMQIRFDGGQPDEPYLAMLGEAGWKDRTESEGVWTKQIDKEARWQSVEQMEREFQAIADAIRRGKGLDPTPGSPAPG